jgi:hypothetical protein
VEQHKQSFLGVQELAFVTFNGLPFQVFHPVYFGPGHNFFNFVPFFMIISVPNVPIRGVQILIGHQKEWSFPFGSGLP